MHKQTRIAQKDHDLFTVEAKKTSFSAYNGSPEIVTVSKQIK